MKRFFKGLVYVLTRVILPLSIIGLIDYAAWQAYGDTLLEMLSENTDSEFYTYEEYGEIKEKTAEVRDLLKKSQEYLSTEQQVECRIETDFTETGLPYEWQHYDTTTVYDIAQRLSLQHFTSDLWTQTCIYRRATETSKEEFWSCWTDISPLVEVTVDHYAEPLQPVSYPVEAGKWYHVRYYPLYETDIHEKYPYGYYPTFLPSQLDVLDYELLDTENGLSHYRVTHTPLYRVDGVLGQQYRWKNENGQWESCTPEEFFPWAIDETFKTDFPELYEAFLELVNEHYHSPGESELWFDEDGRLVRAQIDYTLEAYADLIQVNAVNIKEYYVLGTRAPAEWQAFFELKPITRTITYHYGADAYPIVLPDEVVSYIEE